jgi:hypothetical protein
MYTIPKAPSEASHKISDFPIFTDPLKISQIFLPEMSKALINIFDCCGNSIDNMT